MTKKVLLVETDDFYVEVITTFVRLFLQHTLIFGRDLAHALEQIATEKPDLVLLDLDCGRYEGIGIAEGMRDDPTLKHVPVLALSTNENNRDEALTRGCSAFLSKPFKVRELKSLMQRLLSSK